MLIIYFYRIDGFPLYEVPPEKYSAERIIKILLDPHIDSSLICRGRPLNIESSGTFVIDLDSLEDPDDIKKDNFGVWDHSGSHNVKFDCCISGGEVHIGRGVLDSESNNWESFSLRRLHSKHPTNNKFRRMLCLITGKSIFLQV